MIAQSIDLDYMISMRRKVPIIFAKAINALNQVQEFSPRAIPMQRVQRLPPDRNLIIERNGKGEHVPRKGMIVSCYPYWTRLRVDALGIRDLQQLKGQTYNLPPESEYRKAQDIFVRTLRELVETWLNSGRNLSECFMNHPGMRKCILNFLKHNPLSLLPSVKGPSLLGVPKRFSRGRDKPAARARAEAIHLFIELEQHSERERLRRCQRCDRYFFGRPEQKGCPRPMRCASYLAALNATKRRLEKHRKEKLDAARKATADWESNDQGFDWKVYVRHHANVTQKWITQAVNKGDLQPPGKLSVRRGHEKTQKAPARNLCR